MSLIQWNATLCLDIAEIDRQHRMLVETINELDDAMRQGKGKDLLGKILNRLVGYAGTHFKTEERYFAQLGYPETEKHKTEHLAFVTKVTEFKQAFDAAKLGLSVPVMRFLSDWLQDHINGSDREYAPFFHQHGVR
ncbi:MAG TPA: bacteriohemerythrin [Burkholderiales bacterium]|nr:bacteriohemerythrin [Burkholderiales bacterium]